MSVGGRIRLVTSRHLGGLLLVPLALLVGLTPAAQANAPAVDGTTPVQGEGAAVPPLWETHPPADPLRQASPDYVLHDATPDGEGQVPTAKVIRLADGKSFGPYDASPLSDGTSLVGSTYLTERYDTASSSVTAVDAVDVETGATNTTPMPSSEAVIHPDADWTLARSDDGSNCIMHILRPDGSDTDIPSVPIMCTAQYVGGDRHIAYLEQSADVIRVDVDSGTAAILPRPTGGWGQVVVGPHRLFSRREARDSGHPGQGLETITWTDGVGTQLGSVTFTVDGVAYGDEWLPFGDRLLFLPRAPADLLTHPAYPVDLADGTLDAPLESDVVDAEPTGDGRLVLVRADHPTGSVSVVSDDGAPPQFVSDLPQLPQKFADLRLDGDVLRATADGNPVTTASDGSGQWRAEEMPYAESGGVTLVDRGQPGPDASHLYDVTWPGGQRQVSDIGPRLGHGGDLLAVTDNNAVDKPTDVQDVRTGTVESVLPASQQFALDGTWIWTLTSSGLLSGHNTADPSQDFKVGTGVQSGQQQLLDVRGRFALVQDEIGQWVVDTHHAVALWKVPADVFQVQLGDGFVAGFNRTSGPSTPMTASLRVFDLTTDHVEHDFPGLQGGVGPSPPSFSVDEADTPRVSYVDIYHQPRMATLTWLGTPPENAPDTIAPTMQSAPTGHLVRSAEPRTVTWSWSYTDQGTRFSPPSGLASYDFRFRPQTSSQDSTGALTEPADWQGLSAATVSRTIQPGDGGCVSARAHDTAGNVSAWSDDVCTFVDGHAPVPVSTQGPRVGRDMYDDMIEWDFTATDDDSVASYDVQSRVARRGQASFSAWTDAPSQTSWFTYQPKPGEDWCMRFRGHDPAGRVGAWSTPRCRSVPLDASAWYAPSDALKHTSKKMIGGTYLELGYPGTKATLARQGGRTIALDVLRGPGLGDADVFFAGRKLTRLHFAAATKRERLVFLNLPRPQTGTVKIVQVGARHVRFGALAMLH